MDALIHSSSYLVLAASALLALLALVLFVKKPSVPKKERRVINLNMGIAYVHGFTSQLIGVQLAGANILALALSVLSVVAGTVSIAVVYFPGAPPMWLIAGAVGAILAVLIEGLTLGSLIRIRLADKATREVSSKLENHLSDQLNKIEQPLPGSDIKVYRSQVKTYRTAIKLVREDHRRRLREATSQHKQVSSYFMAFFGALASACAGGIFWHTLFSGMDPYVALPLSALFPLVVTGTFVSTELFRETQEQAIREAFRGGSLSEAAIQQETLRLTYQGIHRESVQFMETSEAKQMITAGFKDVLAHAIVEMKPETDQTKSTTQDAPKVVEISPPQEIEIQPNIAEPDPEFEEQFEDTFEGFQGQSPPEFEGNLALSSSQVQVNFDQISPRDSGEFEAMPAPKPTLKLVPTSDQIQDETEDQPESNLLSNLTSSSSQESASQAKRGAYYITMQSAEELTGYTAKFLQGKVKRGDIKTNPKGDKLKTSDVLKFSKVKTSV